MPAPERGPIPRRGPAPGAGRMPYWRRMPPAVFPVILGLFGLALVWRRAHETLGVTAAISDLILGAVTLLYLFAAASYLAKFVARPGILPEDLRVLPGRAGVAALSLSAMLLAAGLAPFAPGPAAAILYGAVAVHAAVAVLVLRMIAGAPPEGRMLSPAMHLTLVGFIVAPVAALPLGLTGLAAGCFWLALGFAAILYAVLARGMARRDTPAPLRPLLAIHVAPVSLFGSAALGLHWPQAALGFGLVSLVFVALLVLRARYVIAAGFSPLWGAFTFPLTAFVGLMLSLGPHWEGFRIVGILALVAATLLIPWIAYRVLRLWAKGVLAVKTNAAVA